MNKKSKTTSADVGKRIDDTKKEIAQLSEELEKLISSNLNKGFISTDQTNSTVKAEVAQKENKLNSIKTQNVSVRKSTSHTKATSSIPVKNVSTDLESLCKKNKTYNQEEAKEFIRQQREKREEQRKNLSSKTKIDQELKKQKLHELQQKSLALVQRNLQLKRARSRSRENRGGEIRIDQNVSYRRPNSVDRRSEQKKNATIFPTHQNPEQKVVYNNSHRHISLREKSSGRENKIKLNNENKNVGNKAPPINDQEYSVRTPLKNITIQSENLTHNSNNETDDKRDKAARKIQCFYRGYRHRQQMKTYNKPKPEEDIANNNRFKETKETQTNTQKQQKEMKTPEWLQPPPTDPYPCNIINTMKRKLQLFINSQVSCRDIGVQSSVAGTPVDIIDEHINHKSEAGIVEKSPETKASHLKYEDRSDLNSYMSHKCNNLDAEALKHLALIHNKTSAGQKKGAKLKSDSESDTSKNIPEISTESDTGRNNFLDKDNILTINTDRIKHLRLKNPNEQPLETIQSKSDLSRKELVNDKSMSKKSYTFNFYDEVGTNSEISSERTPSRKLKNFPVTPVNVNEFDEKPAGVSPNDSIVSFNRSDYDDIIEEQFLSRSPRDSIISFNKTEENSYKESQSDTEIKTENSYIPSREDNSKKKQKMGNLPENNKERSRNILRNITLRDGRNSRSPNQLIETIEKSLNTSLVSHISEASSESSRKSHKKSQVSKLSNENLKNTVSALRSLEEVSQKLSQHISESSNLMPKDKSAESTTRTGHKISRSSKTSSVPEMIQTKEVSSSNSGSSDLFSSRKSDKRTDNNVNTLEFFSLVSSKLSSSESDSALKLKKDSDRENSEELSISSKPPDKMDLKFSTDVVEVPQESQAVKKFNGTIVKSKADTNEIHLKFEAEVHLLNDFNESLKQFMAVEKAFESIRSKNDTSRIESRHSHTSKDSSRIILSDDSKVSTHISKNISSSINISRGSDFDDTANKPWSFMNNSHLLQISNTDCTENKNDSSFSCNERMPNNLAGLSLKMFEQLIKDEDVRIENLKTIIKIREQALLDRTKGELAWLEIQRKHLKETGKLHEASLVKKKQRGILLKHQQERREMQRLKQLQKIQSNERKTILKEQRNLIKAKLTSEKIMSELKTHTPRKRKSSGPMKVLKSSESIHSETSISKKASDGEEIYSITSRSHSIRLSEFEKSQEVILSKDQTDIKMMGDNRNLNDMKKALLIRQTALMKRRKAVEDLLQRHQKLLEEEKKIEELEMAANAIIMQMPTMSQLKPAPATKLKVKGDKLNELIQKIGVPTEKKFLENKTYCLSQSAFNKLEAQAENYRSNHKNSQLNTSVSETSILHISGSVVTEKSAAPSSGKEKSDGYSEDFESDTQDIESDVLLVPDTDESNISSISELIQNFSRIEHGISELSKRTVPSTLETQRSSTSSENITESLKDSSVIETNVPSSAKTRVIEASFNDKHEKDWSLRQNETLEKSLEDEEVSKMIHDMAPSSSVSETSMNVEKIEEENEITEEIQEKLVSHSGTLQEIQSPETEEQEEIESLQLISNENEEKVETLSEIPSNGQPETNTGNISEELMAKVEEHSELVSNGEIDSNIISYDSKLSRIENNSSEVVPKNMDEIPEEHLLTETADVGEVSVAKYNGDNSLVSENIQSRIMTEEASDLSKNEIEALNLSLRSEKELITSEPENELVSNRDISESSHINEEIENNKESDRETVPETSPHDIASPLENRISEKYETLTNLFKSRSAHSSNLAEDNSTDISEKLSTDSEHIDVVPSPVGSSSDNYTDDFEDDKEEDSNTTTNLNRSNSDAEESKNKRHNKEDVIMVKIDLTSPVPENEAKIFVLNEKQQKNDDEVKSNCPEIKVNGESLEEISVDLMDDANKDSSEQSENSSVKKLVSEILASTVESPKSGEKAIRYQDYYVTTYEDVTPINSPEAASPVKSTHLASMLFGNEAEELLKKQLAIEQEIKHLEQQQKEQLPFVYMREIPNKPPPPYTPPSIVCAPVLTILPAKIEDLNEICKYSSKVLFNAYLSNNLNGAKFSEARFKSISRTRSSKECCLFVFDLCREVAQSHYKKFEKVNSPSWLKLPENSRIILGKPYDYSQLERHINSRVKELLGFEKPSVKETSIVRKSRKKRDHVDEILVLECQEEEREWLSYDKDELMVKNEVTNEILDILLNDTIGVFRKIFS